MGIVTLPSTGWFDAGPPKAGAVAAASYPVDVHLILVRKMRLLVVRQAVSGLWLLPSSGLRADETVAGGACRTALEQVNLYVDSSDVHLAHVQRRHDGTGPRFSLFVQARQFRGVPVVTDRRIHDRLGWCPPTRMPEPTAPHIAAAISAWDKRTLSSGNGPAPGGEPARAGGNSDEGKTYR